MGIVHNRADELADLGFMVEFEGQLLLLFEAAEQHGRAVETDSNLSVIAPRGKVPLPPITKAIAAPQIAPKKHSTQPCVHFVGKKLGRVTEIMIEGA